MLEEERKEPKYNPTHLAKLKEGVDSWNPWYKAQRISNNSFTAQLEGIELYNAELKGIELENANLKGAKLNGTNLEGAYLKGANLEGTYLSSTRLNGAVLQKTQSKGAFLNNAQAEGVDFHEAQFKDANLNFIRLKGAHLDYANFEGADLKNGNLEGANLDFTQLNNANLEGANLEGAKLKNTNLKQANLQDADLTNANLAYAQNINFSDNKIDGAIITSTTTAPWLILKKSYTNTMMLFTLAAVFAFFIPYIVNIATWRSVNLSQTIASDMQPTLSAVSQKLETYKSVAVNNTSETILVLDVIQILSDKATTTTLCLAEECKSWEIWQLLLGVRRQWSFAILSIILIAYNAFRIYLTQQVSILRDSEQATGLTPHWQTTYFKLFNRIPIWPIGGYQHLHWLHKNFVRWIFWAALISFAFHSYAWLRDLVLLPIKS